MTRHYLAVKGMDTYLAAVSEVSPEFTISPYHFALKQGNLNVSPSNRVTVRHRSPHRRASVRSARWLLGGRSRSRPHRDRTGEPGRARAVEPDHPVLKPAVQVAAAAVLGEAQMR